MTAAVVVRRSERKRKPLTPHYLVTDGWKKRKGNRPLHGFAATARRRRRGKIVVDESLVFILLRGLRDDPIHRSVIFMKKGKKSRSQGEEKKKNTSSLR